MTVANAIASLPIGQTSTSSYYAPLVGSVHQEGATVYMLVKSSGAITAAQNAMLLFDSTGYLTYLTSAVSGAAAVSGTLAGVAQLPSADVATLTYFWVARRGPATITVAGAIAAGAVLATHGTAGALDDTTVTYDTACGRAMNAIASGTGTALLQLG